MAEAMVDLHYHGIVPAIDATENVCHGSEATISALCKKGFSNCRNAKWATAGHRKRFESGSSTIRPCRSCRRDGSLAGIGADVDIAKAGQFASKTDQVTHPGCCTPSQITLQYQITLLELRILEMFIEEYNTRFCSADGSCTQDRRE